MTTCDLDRCGEGADFQLRHDDKGAIRVCPYHAEQMIDADVAARVIDLV